MRAAQYAVRGELYLKGEELSKSGREILYTNGAFLREQEEKILFFLTSTRSTFFLLLLLLPFAHFHSPPSSPPL